MFYLNIELNHHTMPGSILSHARSQLMKQAGCSAPSSTTCAEDSLYRL